MGIAELAAMRSGSASAVAPSRVLIHNLGSGKGMSVLEMVKGLEEASGKKLAYKMLDRRPGDLGIVVANPAKARADFGWQTKRGIKEIMESAWKWQSENPYGYEDAPNQRVSVTERAEQFGRSSIVEVNSDA